MTGRKWPKLLGSMVEGETLHLRCNRHNYHPEVSFRLSPHSTFFKHHLSFSRISPAVEDSRTRPLKTVDEKSAVLDEQVG